MKKIYIIVLILSKQLFGAATSGQNTKKDRDRALALQRVAAIRTCNDAKKSTSVFTDQCVQIGDMHKPTDCTLRLYREQQTVFDVAEYHAWLNSRHAVKPPASDVFAEMAHCTLQQKIIKQNVQDCMHGAHDLKKIIHCALATGDGGDSLVQLLAQKLFCPLLKANNLPSPFCHYYYDQEDKLSYSIDMSFYPELLRQFFTGVSLEHYDMHDMLPQLDHNNEYYLDCMRLNSLHGLQNIHGVDSAQVISACHNDLTEVPNMSELTQLQDLDLEGNKIARFPDKAFMPASLLILSLGSNQLTKLPSKINKFAFLQRLLLFDNKLTCLPDTIDQLNQLIELDLSANGLTVLPDTVCNLTQLTDLRLDHNQLTLLPKKIGNLMQLEIFYLDHNRLTFLPETMYQLNRLRELNLSHNPISSQEREQITLQISQSTNHGCYVDWE